MVGMRPCMGQEGQVLCIVPQPTQRRGAAVPNGMHYLGSVLATMASVVGPMGHLRWKLACGCIANHLRSGYWSPLHCFSSFHLGKNVSQGK